VSASVVIRPVDEVDRADLLDHVTAAWGAAGVAAHGELIYPAKLPGFVALTGSRIVGHVSFRQVDDCYELTSIEAAPRQAGVGSRLMEAVEEEARESGARLVWLTTTNDNLDALRFYQRRGFRLRELRPGAVDQARRELKPELPGIGSYGIPMRDELDLELILD